MPALFWLTLAALCLCCSLALSPVLATSDTARKTPSAPAPACHGANCTVFVTVNTSKCPDGFPCYRSLSDAADNRLTHQTIELLDENAIMTTLAYFAEARNITILSRVETFVRMDPSAAESRGPIIVLYECHQFKIIGIKIGHSLTSNALIVADRTDLIVERMFCEKVELSVNSDTPIAFSGGCIFSRNARLRVSDSTFLRNRVHIVHTGNTAYGGAIVITSGIATILNSNFTGNLAVSDIASGGAVYVRKGSLLAYNSTFESNHATGVSEAWGGAIYASSSDLDISLCAFRNNSALAREPMSIGGGGAVYQLSKPLYPIVASFSAVLTLNSFINNEVRGIGQTSGGAVSLTARNIMLHQNNFTGNRLHHLFNSERLATHGALTVRGGAARLVAHDFHILNNTFFGNSARAPSGYTPGWAFGGAVEMITDHFSQRPTAAIFLIQHNRFEENVASGGKSMEDNTGGYALGGALRIVTFDTRALIRFNSFDLNRALGGDGLSTGGSAEGGALNVNVFDRSSFPRPSSDLNDASTSWLWGSKLDKSDNNITGHYMDSTIMAPTLETTDSFSSHLPPPRASSPILGFNLDDFLNISSLPSIRLAQEAKVMIRNNTFVGNRVAGGIGTMIGGDATGGAFYFEGSSLELYGCSFDRNQAIGGDTIYNSLGANTGGYGKGGALHINQYTSRGVIVFSSFFLNEARGGAGWKVPNRYSPLQYGRGGMAFGGALAAWASSDNDEKLNPLAILECEFYNNLATGGFAYLSSGEGVGGAIWGKRLVVAGTELVANRAASGGALYAIDLRMHNSVFSYNQAKATTEEDALGGALCVINADILDCSFVGNLAITASSEGNAMGGAIHSIRRLSVETTWFSRNYAVSGFTASFGGAISSLNVSVVQNCDFKNNSAIIQDVRAIANGGSIFLQVDEPLLSRMVNVHIFNSTASYGGGVYMRGNFTGLRWENVTMRWNQALLAGGGMAILPSVWTSGLVEELCSTCVVEQNEAVNYGPDIITPYMGIVGVTSRTVDPGLPFHATFHLLDFTRNTVKAPLLTMTVSRDKDLLFQSGVWQNLQEIDMKTGHIYYPAMTTWGAPGSRFILNFTLGEYLRDFSGPRPISITIPYTLADCPSGYRLDTTSTYIACQLCLSGLYSFESDCKPCPDDASCAKQNDTSNPHQYFVSSGFAPSPKTNPVAIIECPYTTTNDKDSPSSCLETLCVTNCGADRVIISPSMDSHHDLPPGSLPPPPPYTNNSQCQIECSANNCAPGFTGFLCTQCVCNDQTCYYPADQTCHKCHHKYLPTVIVSAVAVLFFILFKGTLLVIIMVLLSVAVGFLLAFGLISTLIPSIIATAFIIFAEAQRGSSAGLIKSFVFFVQTASVFLGPDVLPRQLSFLGIIRVLTQFRVVGLECLSRKIFGDPFQRFIFAMLLPIGLLLLVFVLYWLCEFLRMISFFRAIQDFDPLESIPFFRSRFHAAREMSHYSLLKDGVKSDNEATLVYDSSYMSDSSIVALSGELSPLSTANAPMSWKQVVQTVNWKIGRVALFLIFAAHFELCNRILEVFAPCVQAPSEGFSYSSTYPWLICSTASRSVSFFSAKSVHGRMAIAGVLFGVLYIVGVPAGFAYLLYWKRQEIKAGDVTTGQWLGLLYNSYRPSMHYFELAWLARRIIFSAVISVIPHSFVSYFFGPVIILLVSLHLQRRFKPFTSKDDNNMEVISLIAIIFAVCAKLTINYRPNAHDTVVWKWTNLLVLILVAIVFLYKLFKPFLIFMRAPKHD